MNQDKIGKLIAQLRKNKNLTQAELGDMVGVGYRAVSKWERGITLPDISIINELSTILGITSDELLKGELNDNHLIKEPTNNKKYLLLIPALLVLIISIIFIITTYKNKTYIYNLTSNDLDYYVEGTTVFKNDIMTIHINKIIFTDKSFRNMMIKNYGYEIKTNNKLLFALNYPNLHNTLNETISIDKFTETFIINYTYSEKVNKNGIIKDKIILTMMFTDENNAEIIKIIPLKLEK